MNQNEPASWIAPLVSVLMPAYNHERWIAEAIDSVVSQSYRPIELVIMNDGSKDRTGEIAKEYQRRHPEIIRYFEQDNKGLCATLNALIRSSEGAYIKLLASDDLLPVDVISSHIELLKVAREPAVKACFGARRCINDDGLVLPGIPEAKQVKGRDYFENILLGRAPCMLQQMTIARVAIAELGFDEKLASEDIDFLLRYFQRFSAVKDNKLSVYYRVHEKGLSKKTIEITSNTLYVLSKVERDSRFQALGWKRILAVNHLGHAISLSATGKKRLALKKLLRAICSDPLALNYVPGAIPQVLVPYWFRKLARIVRNFLIEIGTRLNQSR